MHTSSPGEIIGKTGRKETQCTHLKMVVGVHELGHVQGSGTLGASSKSKVQVQAVERLWDRQRE